MGPDFSQEECNVSGYKNIYQRNIESVLYEHTMNTTYHWSTSRSIPLKTPLE